MAINKHLVKYTAGPMGTKQEFYIKACFDANGYLCVDTGTKYPSRVKTDIGRWDIADAVILIDTRLENNHV